MSNQTKAQGYEGLILRGMVILIAIGIGAYACNWIVTAFANFGPAPDGIIDGNLTACNRMPACVSSLESPSDEAYVAPISLTISVEDATSILSQIVRRLPNAQIREQNGNYIFVRIGSNFNNASDLEIYINAQQNVIQLKLEPRASATELEWTREQIERLRSLYEQELE